MPGRLVTRRASLMAPSTASARERFTRAERKVADVVAADSRAVAFATVAQMARRARVSGPTVVRFAAKAGFDGYTGLQAQAQAELARELRPAAERIRERPRPDPIEATRLADEDNVRATLAHVDRRAFRDAVAVIADRRRRVLVLSGEASRPAGMVLAAGLDGLRDGVTLIEGSEVAAIRHLARS